MKIYRHSNFLRIIAVLLIAAMVMPLPVSAVVADEIVPYASDYLESYNTYIYPAAWGKIQVWFSVTGVNDMDDIGVLNVLLYESKDGGETWTWIKTYGHEDYDSMLGHDKIYHSGYVEYAGTIGRHYKAYVYIWAGKDGDGDTRYMWTQPKKATLFAS